MKAYLIYERLYDVSGNNLLIGGIETYLLYLSKVLRRRGIDPIIVQAADVDFIRVENGINFWGFSVSKRNLYKRLFF